MKLRTIVIALAAMLTMPTISNAANKNEKLYLCGIATSFNDSTVYITEIQQMDSTWVDEKTGFLYSRDNYSYQLRDYLKQTNALAHPTCITIYGKTRKDIEKKYVALRKRYTNKGLYNVKYLNTEFRFMPIVPDVSEQYSGNKAPEQKAAKQKVKKSKKK